MTPLQRNRRDFALISAKLSEQHTKRIKAILDEFFIDSIETEVAKYEFIKGNLVITFK